MAWRARFARLIVRYETARTGDDDVSLRKQGMKLRNRTHFGLLARIAGHAQHGHAERR